MLAAWLKQDDMNEFDQKYLEILQIVSAQRRRKFLLRQAISFCYLLGFLVAGLVLGSLLDLVFDFATSQRLIFILILFFVAVVLVLSQIVFPLYKFWFKSGAYSIETIALDIGNRFQVLHDDLLNALQVYRITRENREQYSLDLAGFAIQSALTMLKGFNFSPLYSLASLKKAGEILLASVFLSLLVWGILPNSFPNSLNHILHPATQFKPRLVEAIIVLPGNVSLVEGDSCNITIRVKGAFHGNPVLSYRQEAKEIFEQTELAPDSARIYHYLFKELQSPIRYFVKAHDQVSDLYTIQVEKRPFMRRLQLKLEYPSYTDLPIRYQEDNVGDVSALVGTRVQLLLQANKSLKQARQIFSDGKIKPLRIANEEAEGEFEVRREQTYHIELEDKFGYVSIHPIEYLIRPLPDQFPVVEVVTPGTDVDLSEELKLLLTIEAEDDFGFSRLRLGYRIAPVVMVPGALDTVFHYLELPLVSRNNTKIAQDFLWDLSNLQLMPEDLVYYFAEIWDNDRISGPKRGLSRIYTARFPSIAEIYDEVAQGQNQDIEKLEDVLNESKELKEKLGEIARELSQQQQIDWLKKQDLEELVQKQQELQKSVDEIKKNLDEMIERLESNQVVSQETLQKFQELQQLFQEIMTPELQKALEELRKAYEEMNEDKLKQAMAKVQVSQENLLKNLERTINLFKRLQLEQRLDQAAKLTENLAERQKTLNQQLEKAAPQETMNLLYQQQKLQEDTKGLEQMLASLEQDLNEQAQFQSATMDSLTAEIQEALRQMKNSQQQLQTGQMQQASRTGKLTEQELRQMLQQLQQLKSSFTQAQKQQFMSEFDRASQDLLRLSQAQEDLLQQTKGLSPASPQIEPVAETQQGLQQYLGRVTEQLYQLSQKTFFVTPEIGRAIGKSVSGMQKALQNLEARNSEIAADQQAAAMGGINESIVQIQAAMQNMSNASSAVGFEEFMKRLEQMSAKQQGLNQQTLELGMQGQMSLEQQAAMARLAAEQEALRKSMEQLQKEFGNRSEILGRLEGVSKEMEDVVKDLERKQVSPRTLDRQKRILSRLLDSQRSLQERDYSKQRESKPGKSYFVRSPAEIEAKIKPEKERFLEDLIRARKVGYNEDYLELIRNYFQALSEKERTQ